jgi:glycerophosphoryl diester phosphodiesterase
LVSAHRAGAGIVPENTLMAFDLCVTSEAFDIDLFELDVHLTRDGKLVVLTTARLTRRATPVNTSGTKRSRRGLYTRAVARA